MATVAEVINRAGNDLGILRLNQALQAQDEARIRAAYNEVYAQLKKDGLAIWASDGDVPDDVAPYVSAMMCENCLSTYGVSPDRYTRIMNAFKMAERQIRKYTAPKYASQDDAVDY